MNMTKEEWIEKVSINNYRSLTMPNGNTLNYNTAFNEVPDHLKNDKDIVLAALLKGGEFFRNIPLEFKNNKEFVTQLLDTNYLTNNIGIYKKDIFYYLPTSLEKETDLIKLFILKTNELDSTYGIPYSIYSNKETVLELLAQKNIFAFIREQSPENSKTKYYNDIDILNLYIPKYNPNMIILLADKFKNKLMKDSDFIVRMLQSSGQESDFYKNLYLELPEKFKTNLDIIGALLTQKKDYIKILPEELKNDKGFMSYAITKFQVDLQYASLELQKDYDLVTLNVSIDGTRLKQSSKWSSDSALGELALKTSSDIANLGMSSLKDKELIIKYLKADPKNCEKLLNMCDDFEDDFDIVKLNIEYDPKLLLKMPNFKDHPELCRLAVEKTQQISFASLEDLKSKDYVINLLTIEPKNIVSLFNTTNYYNNDIDIVKIAMKHNVKLLARSPFLKANRDIIEYGLQECELKDMDLIDPSFKNDIEVVCQFLKVKPSTFSSLPFAMKNDPVILQTYITHALNEIDHKNINMSSIDFNLKNIYSCLVYSTPLINEVDLNLQLIKINPLFYHYIDDISPLKDNPEIIHTYMNSVVNYNSNDENKSNINFVIPEKIFKKYNINHEYVNDNIEELKIHLHKYLLDLKIPNKNETKKNKLKI